jgi:DNA-binding MarR family transcriptional regulator
MTRRRTKQLFTKTLPLAVIAGAGVTAVLKSRAARRPGQSFPDRTGPESYDFEPPPVPPVAVVPLAPEGALIVTEVIAEPSADGGDDVVAPAAAPTSTTATAALGKQPATAGGGVSARAAATAGGGRPRGASRADILAALARGGTMTAAEVTHATGLGRSTVSSTLTRLTRTGEVAKSDRGYQLVDGDSKPPPAARKATASARARRVKVTTTPASTPARTPASSPARTPASAPARRRASAPARRRAPAGAKAASTGSRSAPGGTKAKVLAALSTDHGLTSGEVATTTGLGRATVSTTLSRMAKTGEVVKAERGYRLPG